MKKLLALIPLLSLVGCNEWTNPIATTTYVKGDVQITAIKYTPDNVGGACTGDWERFVSTYEKPLPFEGADKDPRKFAIGNAYGSQNSIWFVLNTGALARDSSAITCVHK